ncbi:MAG: DMT family transporter [Pseudomonadota bacterium]
MSGSKSAPLLGALLGLTGVLIFSGTLPATRFAVATFDPVFITFTRALLATIAAIICLKALKRPFPKTHWKELVFVGATMIYGFPGLMALAMLTVPSAHGGVIMGILPLGTAVFAVLLTGERPSALFWLVGLAGAAVITLFAFRDGEGFGLVAGDIWLLLAAIIASSGYVVSGRLTAFMPGWEVICWALILWGPVALVGTILSFDGAYLAAESAQIGAMLYLGLGSMFLGFFFFNAGMKLGGIARVGQLQLMQTFFTLAIAGLILGERVTLETWSFAAVVIALVVAGQRARISAGP